ETVGIIGKNGAGKSTLLKMITGVLTSTSGSIEVHGKIASLLELGAGFNPEMTGYENIYLNGTLMGFTKEEMDSKVADILEFADIGEFIHQPVKTYSSGMFARLAFSVAINIEPEILIVDEVLSVGDMFFQAKSIAKMKSMIEDKNTTVLFVSHEMGAVKSICKKAIHIEDGKLINYDTSEIIIEAYFKNMVSQTQTVEIKKEEPSNTTENFQAKHDLFQTNTEFEKRASFQRIQNGKADFINVVLLNRNGEECIEFEYGEQVTLRMAIQANIDMDILGHGYFIRDSNGNNIIYSDSLIENCSITQVKAGNRYIADWQFELKLGEDNYSIVSALALPLDLDLGQYDFCDYIPLSLQFHIQRRRPYNQKSKVYWKNNVDVELIV
ncbi:MAG TPA: ABC transporter ATP-binding protein, partial [bacterium (Candidatus Stahlbacteria)]|nr:ABC transporter ATP-binding protein [Candidatus Stahlbacteria bacterium]